MRQKKLEKGKMMKNICESFGKKYIGWDGCTTIPVLLILFSIMVWMTGIVAWIILSVLIFFGWDMHRKKSKKQKNERMKNE